jgi:hypothetical protein
MAETVAVAKRKLLIFDLNKVLLCKNKHRRTSYFLRPWAIEFVNEMKSLYDIAVWTSGKPETMNAAMQRLFSRNGNQEELVFYWTQHDCTMTAKSPRQTHSLSNGFKKELSRVWDRFPQYNQHNTVPPLPAPPFAHCIVSLSLDPARRISRQGGPQPAPHLRLAQEIRCLRTLRTL